MRRETTAKRLQQIMDQRQLRQVDILRLCEPYCQRFGVRLGKSDLSQYISGKVEPGSDKLGVLGNALGVSEAWLMGFDVPAERNSPKPDTFDIFSIPNILPLPEMTAKPLIGTIACGTPILAVENIEDRVMVPKDIRCDFVLRCKGDSMINACIMDGSLVYVREQPDVENGDIAAVIIEDDSDCHAATLKRVYKSAKSITLMPENNRYAPTVFTLDEMNRVRILGVVVAWTNFL